jgi:MFS family permease
MNRSADDNPPPSANAHATDGGARDVSTNELMGERPNELMGERPNELLGERPTSIRLGIVWISVLMAFGLYLTRVSVGEIVKSNSFLEDPQIINSPSTRFSVQLTEASDPARVKAFIAKEKGDAGDPGVNVEKGAAQPQTAPTGGEATDPTGKLVMPMTVADGLPKGEAERLLGELEGAGGSGQVRLSKQQIGSVLGVFFFTYALLQVPAGWFSDRLGARKMLSLYILLWSLLTGITGSVTSLTGLLVARLGFGFAQAGAYPTSSAIVRKWVPLAQRGRSSALIAFGGRLGATLAPFLTMWLILNIGGWRPTLWLYGVAGVLIAAAYFAIVRDRPSEHPACNAAELALIGPVEDQRQTGFGELIRLVGVFCRSRSLWLNSLCQFSVNFGWVFLVTWLPTYLKEVQKVPEQQGAVMVSIVLAMGMLGQLIGGRATDWSVGRFGLRGRPYPIATAAFIAGCAYLACLRIDNVWGVVACCAIVSMMTDVGNPSIWGFMQDVGGRNTGSIFGWGNMWGNFGAAISAKVVPLLMVQGSQGGGGQSLVFITCAGAFFVAALAALGMDATKPLKVEAE